jgi:Tfp pilus assembly protein PilO|tara:strand:- start:966 stop:1658 length:693 start_codon:yes stop_codon:yes gene_type:complete
MDLNIDFKNLKIEDIKEKLLKLADKKTLIKIGIGAGAVIIFLIIYYAVLNPIVKKKKIQLDDMNKKKQETTELIQKIKSKQKKINKLKPRYEQYSTLFHSKAEVEGLYNTLSVFAGENDLVISKIEKKEIKQVTKAAALESVSKKKKKKKKRKKKGDKIKKENVAYYTIPVDFEITGNFIGYIKFKRALSLSQKMLNFDKESIEVVKGDSTGAIKVKGTLTIVGLADDFF